LFSEGDNREGGELKVFWHSHNDMVNEKVIR